MFTIFAHAGHDMESMNKGNDSLPIIIGAGVTVVILVAIIVYLLAAWEPKKPVKVADESVSRASNTIGDNKAERLGFS